MRPARLVPATLMAVLLAGCGGSSGGSASAPAASPALTPRIAPVAALRAAGDKAAAATSSKLAFMVAVVAGGQTTTISGDGGFDFAAHRGSFTVSLGAPGRSQQIEERLIGGTAYIAPPGAAQVFYQVKSSDLVGTSFGKGTDPSQFAKALDGVTDDARLVGPEQVRGIATSHYAGTVDAANSKLGGPAGSAARKVLAEAHITNIPYDAYVDGQGRLVKVVTRLDLPAGAQTGGQPVQTTSTVELFDFGAPVTVTAPPAAQVRNGAPLLKALRQSSGGAPT